MSRPQSTTSARVTHCHKTICNQYTFRNLSIRTEHVSKVHTTTRLTHSMMCSHLFLVLFHFLYLGIDSSSNGSICSRMYDIAWALFIIRSIHIYVCGHYMVTCPDWTPIFEWQIYMRRFVVKEWAPKSLVFRWEILDCVLRILYRHHTAFAVGRVYGVHTKRKRVSVTLTSYGFCIPTLFYILKWYFASFTTAKSGFIHSLGPAGAPARLRH